MTIDNVRLDITDSPLDDDVKRTRRKEKEEYWNNREIKYEMVIHAEENAILNCPFDIRGSKIYITHKPCHKCLIRLYQAGVVEVYYINDYIRSTHSQIWDLHASKFKLVKQLSITDQ